MPKNLRTVRTEVKRARRLTGVDQHLAVIAELRLGYTQDEVAQKYEMSKGWVSIYASIEKMPPYLQDAFRTGQVTDVTALGKLYRISKRSRTWADVVYSVVKSGEKLTRQLVYGLNFDDPRPLVEPMIPRNPASAASVPAFSDAERLLVRFQKAFCGANSLAALANLKKEVDDYLLQVDVTRDLIPIQAGNRNSCEPKSELSGRLETPSLDANDKQTTLYWILTNHGGPLLTGKAVASILGRSQRAILQATQQGIGDPELVVKLKACRAQLGRRVMFRATDIASMIDAA